MEYNQMSIEELNNEKERLLKEIDGLNENIMLIISSIVI
jgi:hypothetical protein